MCHWKLIPTFFSYEGIKLDSQDKNGYSVLYSFLKGLHDTSWKNTKGNQWYGFVQRLITRCPSLMKLKNKYNETILHQVLSFNCKPDILLTLMLYSNHIINERDSDGGTVLHDACSPHGNVLKGNKRHSHCQMNRQIQCLDILLKQPNINVNIQNSRGFTALHYACYFHHKEAIKLLVKRHDIKFDILDNLGNTAVHAILFTESKKLPWSKLEPFQDMFGSADDELFKLVLAHRPYLLRIKNHSNKTVLDMAYAAIKGVNNNPSEKKQLKNTIELFEDCKYQVRCNMFNFIKTALLGKSNA